MNAKTEKDDDLVAVRSLGDGTGGKLQVTEVGSTAGTDTEGLRGSLPLTPRHHTHIHSQEHHISLLDGLLHLGREMQILATGLLHNFKQTRLIDGEVVAVPLLDALLVQIHNVHSNLGALESNDGHRRSTHVASSNTANVLDPRSDSDRTTVYSFILSAK